jgi:hypothetical protein
MNDDEVELLRKTVTGLAETGDGAPLTAALDEFGWLDVLADHPAIAIPAVFGAQGRNATWSAAVHDVLALGLGDISDLAPADVCVVLPRPRKPVPGDRRGDTLRVEGILLGPRRIPSTLIVPAVDDRGATSIVAVAAGGLRCDRRAGLDPRLDVFEVSGVTTGSDRLAGGADAAGWWARAEAHGRLALSHYLAGSLRTMLDLGRAHAGERSQFGQLIGTFQAVRQKLAESHVAVVALESAAAAAWDAGADRPLAAATTKLVASRSTATVTTHIQQVLAGIGFTTEHRFHQFMKRAIVLDRILGSADELAPIVGAQLVGRADAPRLVEL